MGDLTLFVNLLVASDSGEADTCLRLGEELSEPKL